MLNCRYRFHLMNRKLEKATLRLNYSVFPYSSECSMWHLKEVGKPDEAWLKAVGVRVVRAAGLLCGELLGPVVGSEPACVERCVLFEGMPPVARGTAVSLVFRRSPTHRTKQNCKQHRTAPLGALLRWGTVCLEQSKVRWMHKGHGVRENNRWQPNILMAWTAHLPWQMLGFKIHSSTWLRTKLVWYSSLLKQCISFHWAEWKSIICIAHITQDNYAQEMERRNNLKKVSVNFLM